MKPFYDFARNIKVFPPTCIGLQPGSTRTADHGGRPRQPNSTAMTSAHRSVMLASEIAGGDQAPIDVGDWGDHVAGNTGCPNDAHSIVNTEFFLPRFLTRFQSRQGNASQERHDSERRILLTLATNPLNHKRKAVISRPRRYRGNLSLNRPSNPTGP